jgi:5'-methylthioadenosine phosphorylase
MITVGVIGGSGLYGMEGLGDVRSVKIGTPFGDPSDEFVIGTLGEATVVFLPRHGKGHRLSPSEINYRANIYGMKTLGAQHLISVSAVGSMKEKIKPGHIVVVDQFFDRTTKRASTFFTGGIVAHVEFADPVCPVLSSLLYKTAKSLGVKAKKGGTYLCIEGPQFSSRAESRIYRKLGVDVIGMTNMPEAKLAREAEICYSTLALSTDYDCWHFTEASVTVEMILSMLKKNVSAAKAIIKGSLGGIPEKRGCRCGHALKNAIVTAKDSIPEETKKNLMPLIGKYLE